MSDRIQRVLLFGASGQIGERVRALLAASGHAVVAVSRDAQPPGPDVEWRQGWLPDAGGDIDGFDAIVSCGPLDMFSLWYARTDTGAARVVAFGSTSVHVKHDSPDPDERDVAEHLRDAEARMAEAASSRGAPATVLRPTLVYGSGRDRNLSRIAALAREHRFFVLPHDARGLRQPVHVDDLAAATVAALGRTAPGLRAYDLPGGQSLAYRAMVGRVLATLRPRAWLLVLPGPLFTLAAAAARRFGVHDAGVAVLARMREDLVFDAGPARRELGYAPRPFSPAAGTFDPPAPA